MSYRDVLRAVTEISDSISDEDRYDWLSKSHEYQTRYALIDPVLVSLGWDLSNVEQVEVEHEIEEWGRVDYALLTSPTGDPAIIVEAKVLGAKLYSASNQRQVLSYSEGRRKGFAVLTDGDIWRIYDLSKRGGFQSKLVEEFSILEASPTTVARTLNQLLRRNLHWRKS